MASAIEAFLERVEHCNTLQDIERTVSDLREILDVEHAVYHSVMARGEQYALATYSEPWAQHYAGEELFRVDPVVLSAFQRFHFYDWKTLDWSSRRARTFFMEAQEGGVGNQGISVPIRGPGGEFALFTINHRCTDARWAAFLQAHRTDFLLIAHFLHEAVRRLDPMGDAPAVALSPRESEALQLLGMGLNRARIADRLAISEHTLRVYIESARAKLGAANATHAVARALSAGLIRL